MSELPSLVLYQWIGKIFYGIMRKELTLLFDRRDSDRGSIIPKDVIESFSTLHLFLQSIRQPFAFPHRQHFSVLVVSMHHSDRENGFFFRDRLRAMVACLRTDDVGLIVALQDAGIVKDTYGRYVDEVADRRLLPIQFDELFAKSLYQVALLTQTPRFVTAAHDDPRVPTTVHMLPSGGFSSNPIVRQWVQADYAELLASVLQESHPYIDRDELFRPPDRVVTWMNDENGDLTLVDNDGQR